MLRVALVANAFRLAVQCAAYTTLEHPPNLLAIS